jgi:hypothetical protein
VPRKSGISNSDLDRPSADDPGESPQARLRGGSQHQQYNVVNEWFKTDKVQVDSGTSIVRNIILDTSGNARHVRLFQKTGLNVADVQSRITAPWVQVQTSYSIERREALRNRKPAMYIELLKSRRIDGMLSLAELLEQRAWLAPDSTPADDLNPYGLPYWLSRRPRPTVPGYVGAIDVAGQASAADRPV